MDREARGRPYLLRQRVRQVSSQRWGQHRVLHLTRRGARAVSHLNLPIATGHASPLVVREQTCVTGTGFQKHRPNSSIIFSCYLATQCMDHEGCFSWPGRPWLVLMPNRLANSPSLELRPWRPCGALLSHNLDVRYGLAGIVGILGLMWSSQVLLYRGLLMESRLGEGVLKCFVKLASRKSVLW